MNSKETEKKLQERALLSHFLRHMKSLYGEALPDPVDSEEPDFIFQVAGRKLGLEVIRLMREDLRKEEGHQDTVVEKALRLYEAGGGPFTHVSLFWLPEGHFPKKVRPSHEALARVIRRAAQLPEGGVHHIGNDELRQEGLGEFLDQIHVLAGPPMTKNFWRSPGGVWMYPASIDVEAALLKKNAKVAAYRGNCDEVWLLMAASEPRPSGVVDFSEPPTDRSYITDFDRLFALDLGGDRLFSLPVTKPK